MDLHTHLNDVLEGVDIVSFGLDEFAHDEQQCPERRSEESSFFFMEQNQKSVKHILSI